MQAQPVDVLTITNGQNGAKGSGRLSFSSNSGKLDKSANSSLRLSMMSRVERWSGGGSGLSAVKESAPAPASSSEKASRFSQAQASAWRAEGRGRHHQPHNNCSGRTSASSQDVTHLEDRLEAAERRAEAAELRAEMAELRYEEVRCPRPTAHACA